MNKQTFTFAKLIVTLVVGAAIGALLVKWLASSNEGHAPASISSEPKPLYWVAPMDANYRRDQPGKSPMGMDLIPVYEEPSASASEGPGAITIKPSVINNLGVRTAALKVGKVDSLVSTVGYITYDEDKLVHVHPRLAGWIEKLYVKSTGERVEKGDPLYALYSPELVNAQEEFLLAINGGSARLMSAAESRLKALHIPDELINDLKKHRKAQQTVTFSAPQSGVIENLNIREGFYVKPDTTVLSIGDLSEVWVDAEIFERQVSQVKVGDHVSMRLDYLPNREWRGKVDYIYPTLDAQTRTVKVRLRFDNSDHRLKPNMFAQVDIHSSVEQSQVLLPKEALIRTGKQDRVVLALGEGRFKSIAVKVGNSDQQFIEVLSGLDEGDRVVTSAQFLIDSESSKTSDFIRMSQPSEQPQSVWVSATIDSLMVNHRMATFTHAPIAEWQWPEMTMDLIIDQAVDITELSAGLSLHIEITKSQDNDYLVTNTHIMSGDHDMSAMSETDDSSEVSSARVHGVVNSIDTQAGSVNISRSAIEKWDRPAATLDFIIGKSLEPAMFEINQSIDFTFEIRDGEFIVVELYPQSALDAGSAEHNHD